MNEQRNPFVFIGSSLESIGIAEAIQRNLVNEMLNDNQVMEVELWKHGVFEVEDTALPSLKRAAKNSDFAILVVGKEAALHERKKPYSAARDTVIFQLGLFFGIIGRARCFIIKHEEVKLPSNLSGITYGSFSKPRIDSLDASLAPICTRIAEKIKSVHAEHPIPDHQLSITDHYLKWWEKANALRTATEVIQTIEGIEIKVSPSTFSPDVRLTYSPVIAYKNLPRKLDKKKVLDLGTGSGILAISAALRGAEKVVAIDINSSAINDANENVEKLVQEGRIKPGVIEIMESDLFKNVTGKFDYIIANLPIAAEAKCWKSLPDSIGSIILKCLRGLKKHLKKEGKAIFVWASFGGDLLIPELLHSEGFVFESHTEETFGVEWYAFITHLRND